MVLIYRHREIALAQSLAHSLFLLLSWCILVNHTFANHLHVHLQDGKQVRVGQLAISLDLAPQQHSVEYTTQPFRLVIQKDLEKALRMRPSILFYPKRDITKAKTALSIGWLYDVQVVVTQISDLTYLVRIATMPLQCYFWFLGGALAFSALARSVQLSRSLR